MRRETPRILITLGISLQLLDKAITYTLINKGGFHEINPLVASLLNQQGLFNGILISLFIGIGGLLILYKKDKKNIIVASNAIYAIIILYNMVIYMI